jgi:hypothetical protein
MTGCNAYLDGLLAMYGLVDRKPGDFNEQYSS